MDTFKVDTSNAMERIKFSAIDQFKGTHIEKIICYCTY